LSIDRNRLEQEAMRLLQKGDNNGALERYQALLRDNPRDLRVRQKVADLSVATGNKVAAERHLAEIAKHIKAAGNPRQALGVYKQLLTVKGEDAALLGEMGECYLEAGFPTDARRAFERAAELTERVYPDRAVPYVEQLIRLTPGELPPRVRLAELFERANWGERALAAWAALGEEARRLGRPDDRARFLDRGLSLRPDDHELLIAAADARVGLGDYGGALPLLQRGAQGRPDDPRVFVLLGQALQGVEQVEKARQVWLVAARLQGASGDPAGRAESLRRAIACGATDPALAAELQAADAEAARQAFRLDAQPWAEARDEAELRLLVQAEVLARYGFPDRAVAALRGAPAHLRSRPGVGAALVERLVDAADPAGALHALSAVAGPAADLGLRRGVLSGAGAAGAPVADADLEEISGDGLIDDGLIDDGLIDDGPSPDDELIEDEATDPGQGAASSAAADDSFFDELGIPEPTGLPDFASIFHASDADLTIEDDPADEDGDPLGALLDAAPAGPAAPIDDLDALLRVGAADALEARARRLSGLAGELRLAQVRRLRGDLAGALAQLRDALDEAGERDPAYLAAALELCCLQAATGKARAAARTLGEIEGLDPAWRAAEVALVRRGIELLAGG
jgi:tetratricopeptide (TPR) repeat protein